MVAIKAIQLKMLKKSQLYSFTQLTVHVEQLTFFITFFS